MFQFHPFPILTTPRLILRQLSEADVPVFFLHRSDPEIMKYIPRPLATSYQDVRELMERMENGRQNNETINWAMERKDTGEYIGTIGYVRSQPANFRAEVGYMMGKEHHHQGFMLEALQEVVRYGFEEMKLNSIEAVIDPQNHASQKLLEKCGFQKEGHFRQNWFYEGKFLDSVYYAKLASEHS